MNLSKLSRTGTEFACENKYPSFVEVELAALHMLEPMMQCATFHPHQLPTLKRTVSYISDVACGGCGGVSEGGMQEVVKSEREGGEGK